MIFVVDLDFAVAVAAFRWFLSGVEALRRPPRCREPRTLCVSARLCGGCPRAQFGPDSTTVAVDVSAVVVEWLVGAFLVAVTFCSLSIFLSM